MSPHWHKGEEGDRAAADKEEGEYGERGAWGLSTRRAPPVLHRALSNGDNGLKLLIVKYIAASLCV